MKYLYKFGNNYRVGNIELHLSETLSGTNYLEVIRYYNNPDYNHREQFTFDAEKDLYCSNTSPYRYYVSKDCFDKKELYHTIAFFSKEDDTNSLPNVESFGDEPTKLSDNEWNDYKKVLEHFYLVINEN